MTHWRKSSYSSSTGGNCVELAVLGGEIGVRDSKNPEGEHLTFRRIELAGLIDRIRAGELDL